MTKLGKYEVLGELAKGSMGVIYRARDPILDREVALKTIAGTGSVDPEMKERFYREARSGARLHHPNVITVYELGEQDGLVFIALELLSGCDLRQFIRERRSMPAARKIEAMAAVCDGLHHAHQNGIVHRDMKPSNVFLTDEGVPKILDFGVARLSASKLTVVGRVLGTPFYMAPEQIMGQPCDVRSDLFSVALVTYELLTYKHPFAGDAIPRRILNDRPDSLTACDPELPAELEAVLNRALAKDPAQRYQTAEELGLALRSVPREPATTVQGREAAAPSRDAPAPVEEPAETPAVPIVPKNANTETKMSAILTALQGFDQAIERKDVRVARAALAIIEELAKVDDRFVTAAKGSRVRLTELEASMPPVPVVTARPGPSVRRPSIYRAEPLVEAPVIKPPAPEPPVVREQPRARVTVPPPAAAIRVEEPAAPARPEPPPSRSLDDATSIFRVPEASGQPPAPPPTSMPRPPRPPAAAPPRPPAIPPLPPPRTSVVRPPETPAPPAIKPAAPPATQPAAPGAHADRIKLLIGGGAAVFLIVALAGYFVFKPGSATKEPAEATAKVTAAQSAILSTPSDSADVVVKLKKGDTVNVMHPPRSASQEWTEVQYIAGGRTYPKGVIKTADLGNWNSPKPNVALFLIEMSAPPDGAGEAQLRQYAESLKAFIQHFSATPQRADAQAELDTTNAALARLGGGSPAASQSKTGRQQPQPPPQPKAPAAVTAPGSRPQPVLNIEAELVRANQQWENGQYAQAERTLKRILQQSPDDAVALDMLRKVEKAKQLEGKQ